MTADHEPARAPSQGVLRSARRLQSRKGREAASEFLAEGPQAVREAVAAGVVTRCFVSPEGEERLQALVTAAREAGAEVYRVSETELAGISDTVTPQGIVATCRDTPGGLDELLATRPRLVVVCAQVRDPGNAGTVIRCADAFGAEGVVLTQGSVEVSNPKTVRASVGSLFHLTVATGPSLAETVAALKENGLRVYAADGSGSVSLTDLERTGDLQGRVAWIFGNEAWGLPAEDRALADRVVRVPMWGRAESLNLATAAAVCLYSTSAAQHRKP